MAAWWFQTYEKKQFHIWDVIPTPLTKSIIFQDGYCTTNQMWGSSIDSHTWRTEIAQIFKWPRFKILEIARLVKLRT
jgi:hypothetical protein